LIEFGGRAYNACGPSRTARFFIAVIALKPINDIR
jgi:hypothetical protein